MNTAARTQAPNPPVTATVPGEGRPVRRGLVRRDRLVSRLAEADDAPLVMLVAPSGYGKTTALADWTEQDGRPCAWLTLDERHNDPALLFGAIAALLDRIEPIPDGVFAPLTMPRAGVSSAVVPRLCAALRERRLPFVLVLDDLDLVDQRDCIGPLDAIARAIPGGSRLAVGTRTEPELPLARLRADRVLTQLGAEELQMTTREASELLDACGLRLREHSARKLVERTEGWSAGLYLAALALAATPDADVDAVVADFHGDDRLVADFLRDAFLAGLDEETLDFLIQTSVLDRLSGEACDAVLEREGSADVLHRLVRSNLLILPLDRRDRTYRYHALLREMLLAELRRADASLAAGLHERASAWYGEHGDVDRAVGHAIEAGDQVRAGNLIWQNTAAYVSRGREATVRGWLESFTERQLTGSPQLCLTQAARLLAEGDAAGVERFTGLALEQLEGGRAPAADSGLAAAAHIISAAGAARAGLESTKADIQAAYATLSIDSPWRSLCRLIEGAALHLTGDLDGARVALEDGARIGGLPMPSVQSLCRAQLALLSIDEGELGEAERQASLSVAEADHYGLGDYPTQALAFAAAALVRARRGRVETAIEAAGTTVRLISALPGLSPWYEAETRITVARALLVLDDAPAARTHLAAAGRYLRRVPDARVLREWFDQAWSEVGSAGSLAGRWPLTPAELRLLHALPTHLSFREIAERHFVSTNTVKTQAQAVYRKLGVSSRAEAVACARAAGLLDGERADSPEPGDAMRSQRA
jgi:LuxR family transcriptional regulator, maltose regulon positive regulatory protein